jgi:hypothetical protein
MTGYHEIRLTGPGREQFRLFCLLENGSDDELLTRGLVKPAVAGAELSLLRPLARTSGGLGARAKARFSDCRRGKSRPRCRRTRHQRRPNWSSWEFCWRKRSGVIGRPLSFGRSS